jgi:threonine dehydratase
MMACEVETAAPFTASLASGRAETVEYTPTFVDGIGGRSMLAEMWPLARDLLDGSFTVSVAAVAGAVKTLVERNHVVAEGAGAASVAAAINAVHDGTLSGRMVCIVSGGNIDPFKLATILGGGIP